MDTLTTPTHKNLPAGEERLLRIGDVKHLTALSRSQIYKMIGENKFPEPIKIIDGGRASAWIGSEIQQYISDRIREAKASQSKNKNA